MQISPDRLLILRAVAASGGVGAAARQLHLAPSGISQHLARLERETGLVLVDRFHSGGQRPLRLTAAGQRLAAHGGRLADVLADAAEDIYAMSERLSGTVNVGAFSSVMTRLVVPAIRDLEQRAPGVQVRVHEASEAQALSALRGGDLDVVLVEDENLANRGARGVSPGIEHGTGRPVLASTTPGSSTTRTASCCPQRGRCPEVSTTSRVDRGSAARPGQRCSSSWTGSDVQPAWTCPPTHVCEEFAAVLALVEAGLGASIVPALGLPVEERPGLRFVGLAEFGVRHLSAVTVATRRQPPLITEMLHALVEAASGSA